MLLRRVLPASGEVLDLAEDDSDARLAEWYAPTDRASVRLMMVATLDGYTVGTDGTSTSISSATDRRILATVRQTSDAVIVGGTTARREAIGRPPGTAIVVVTARGDLSGHRLRPARDASPLIIVTTRPGVERARDTLGTLPHELLVLDADGGDAAGSIAPAALIASIRERTGDHLVCEGGPSLAHLLLSAGLIDEICLTTAPRLGGSHPLTPPESATTAVQPHQVLIDDEGFVYARWRVPASSSNGSITAAS